MPRTISEFGDAGFGRIPEHGRVYRAQRLQPAVVTVHRIVGNVVSMHSAPCVLESTLIDGRGTNELSVESAGLHDSSPRG